LPETLIPVAEALPRLGVTNVGEVAKTAFPVPVVPDARTTFPDPVVFEICDELICPLLLPSGIPAHVPGVPAATFTHAATPFAVAPRFCSMSPCDHASEEGAPEDFVGI
jgi:hypothetical protein